MEARTVLTVVENRNGSIKDMKLNRSLIKSWNALPWNCYYCIHIFQDYKALKNHIQSCHQIINSDDVYYKCSDCNGVSFSYVSFVNHIRRVHYEALKLCCDVCNENMKTYEELSIHRDKHVEAGVVHPIVYHCTICELVQSSEKDLKGHIQDVHSTIYNIICSQPVNQSVEADDDMSHMNSPEISQSYDDGIQKCKDEYFEIGQLFQCGVCVQGFVDDADLQAHMLKHKEEQMLNFENSNKSHLPDELYACKMEFNFEKKLIEEVKKYSILFNAQHPEYKNVLKKEAIWQKIGKVFNLDSEQCKRKWKNLRDTYTRCKKSEELPSGSSAVKRKKWKHYDMLSFLEDIEFSKRSIETDADTSPVTSYRSDCESLSQETIQENQRKRKKSSIHNETLLSNIMDNIKESCDRLISRCNDHVETTFISFAQQIKASDLPKDRVLKLQRRISNLIFDTLEEWEEERNC